MLFSIEDSEMDSSKGKGGRYLLGGRWDVIGKSMELEHEMELRDEGREGEKESFEVLTFPPGLLSLALVASLWEATRRGMV